MEVFLRHARRVRAMLEVPERGERLLKAACADTPIVRDILAAGRRIAARSDPAAVRTLERMEQDLVTFLALREIDARAVGPASLATRRVGAPSDN